MEVPVYEIDLKVKPCDRWNHIIDENRQLLLVMSSKINEEIRNTLGFFNAYIIFPIFFTIVIFTSWLLDPIFVQEMRGISKRSGISLRKIIMLNVGYDFLAKCTSSIVYDKKNNKIWHLRNMDWDSNLLRKMTIHVKFMHNGQVAYEAVTWLGFVGILTGATSRLVTYKFPSMNKKFCFCLFPTGEKCVCEIKGPATISLNFRKEDNLILRNITRYFTGKQPASFAIRRWLQDGDDSKLFDTIAPCYLIIGTSSKLYLYEMGKNIFEKIYNIKDNIYALRRKGFYEEKVGSEFGLNYLVQTNTDSDVTNVNIKWADGDPLLLNSVERKCVNIAALEEYKELDFEVCFEIMKAKPVKNELTVYTTIMCLDPETGNIEIQSLNYLDGA